MNTGLAKIQPYPFEKLANLRAGLTSAAKPGLDLSIGEPKHPTPELITQTLIDNIDKISKYPATRGTRELRVAVVNWLVRRFSLTVDSLDADRHVLPVSGTREALFAIVQCVVSNESSRPLVVLPNPFYQIYEGAALMAGAQPYYVNCDASGFPRYDQVPKTVWERCALAFICTPGNPTGAAMSVEQLRELITLSDQHDFVLASDECYSEIYCDENAPPPGLLQAAQQAGNESFERCLVFHSLSKRSNAPGLRSGFVAGDSELLKDFYRYRTYHGCSMSLAVQAASCAAWKDEAHVSENRRLYRQKFAATLDILKDTLELSQPDGGFYLWPRSPVDDVDFVRKLIQRENVCLLPGSYLGRTNAGENPGINRVRIALVAELSQCIEAAERIKNFLTTI